MHPNDLKRVAVAALMLLTFAALRPSAARADSGHDTPEAATAAFYHWVLAQRSGGLPTPRQRIQLSRLLTTELIQALVLTSNVERQCVAVTPRDMKPPIWEGSIWVGNYEGAREASYGEPHINGRDATVGVDLVDIDDRFPKGHMNRAIAFHDTLKLRKERQGWLVADVIWGNSGESLLAALRKYVKEEAPHCSSRNISPADRQ